MTPSQRRRHEHDENAWAPQDGPERTFYTVLANVLGGIELCLRACRRLAYWPASRSPPATA